MDGLALFGMLQARRNLIQGYQYKTPFRDARMRDVQFLRMQTAMSVKKDIDIDDPGCIFERANTPHFFLYPQQTVQQFPGWQPGIHHQYLVEKIRLTGKSPGSRYIYSRLALYPASLAAYPADGFL